MTGRGDDLNPLAGSDPVAELEAFIARAEAAGEPVPPEAHLMLARLRELMAALHGLTASLDESAKRSASTESDDTKAGPD